MLNKQNKHHFALYRLEDLLEWAEGSIVWADPMLDKRMDSLNKRVSRISPRRGKKVENKLSKGRTENEAPTTLLELLEALNDIN